MSSPRHGTMTKRNASSRRPQRWASPRLTAVVDDPLTVPYRGYYSISFGSPSVPIQCVSEKRKGQKRKLSEAAQSPVADTTAPEEELRRRYALVIEDEENDKEATKDNATLAHNRLIRQIALPWREDSGQNPQILDPPSFHLAKRIWLEANSRLSIRRMQHVQGQQENEKEGQIQSARDANDDNGEIDDEEEDVLYWQVQLQSRQTQRPDQDPRKCWQCRICGRGFLSAWSVSQHQDVAHYEQVYPNTTSSSSSSSIWTTPLETVYNDNYVAVVIKPQGMAVMGDLEGKTLYRSALLMALLPSGNNITRQGKVKFAWPKKVDNGSGKAASTTGEIEDTTSNHGAVKIDEKGDDSEEDKLDFCLGKPRPVHRLDAPTGGLLVVAKTKHTEVALKDSFACRACRKTYWALVYGKMEEDTGECAKELSGRPSLTCYRVLRRSRSVTSPDGWLTTVELYPHTGRHHQLRKHMQVLGHSIWGDTRYGPKQTNDATDEWQSRLCLWAVAIRLPHPVFFPIDGREIDCRMPDPEWLAQVVQHEEALWLKARASEEN